MLVELLKRNRHNLFKPAVVNMQSKYLEEPCIIVDENDRPLRSASKKFCHSTKTLSLHRAFSVFLFTKNREMVLQKRAAQKLTFPLLWTNACCSHPLWNDQEKCINNDDIGVRRAARRKLNHELGIKFIDIERMQVLGRFIYKAVHNDKWGEHEIDHAIVIRNFDEKLIKPNPEEVDEIAVVSMSELERMMKCDEALFSPWFRLFIQMNILQKWWQNLDCLNDLKDFETIHRLN